MRNSFIGCLLGGAIGDALGMPVEGVPESVIREKLGEHLEDFYDPLPNARTFGLRKGMYTDDTQAVRVIARSLAEKGELSQKAIAEALHGWLYQGTLGEDPRNPGPTTCEALRVYAMDRDVDKCGRDSNSCGAAIRITPVALWCSARSKEVDFQSAIEDAARITHIGETAVDGARVVAELIRLGLKREKLDEDHLIHLSTSGLMRDGLRRVFESLTNGLSPDVVSQEIGSGTEAHRVVPRALYHLARKRFHFEPTLLDGLNTLHPAGCDMDSILSIAGAIAGVHFPEEVMKCRWAQLVENRELIVAEATKLHACAVGEV